MRVADAELADRRRRDARHEQFLHAEPPGKVDRAPDDPPQDVAAPFVARNNPVGDEHGRRPAVFGHRADGEGTDVAGREFEVIDAHDRRRGSEDGEKDVRLVDRVDALEHAGQAFEAAARVDVAGRQIFPVAVRVLVELHEDKVPDLEEALFVEAHADAL